MTEELHEEVLDSLAELDKLCTVFDGASQEDVAYAKVFWSSLSLQPPIESRLVSADIRQRLRAAKTPHSTNASAKQASWSKRDDEIQQDVYLKQKQEERQKYMEMAKKREQIIALLKKQRDERIKKEMISYQNKTRKCNQVDKRCYFSFLSKINILYLIIISSGKLSFTVSFTTYGHQCNKLFTIKSNGTVQCITAFNKVIVIVCLILIYCCGQQKGSYSADAATVNHIQL
uniref:Cilia- and flagella-associated protein HOATZ n=1 Tax=Cyprinus carpio TaxID=7962 RepID=A0A8C1LAP7_CYPCA